MGLQRADDNRKRGEEAQSKDEAVAAFILTSWGEQRLKHETC
jgi:hypothetical protein